MITIIDTPTTHSPVYNKIEWSCSSSNDTEPNFKYIVQIYDGVTELAFLRIRPEPNTGNDLLILDVADILQNYIEQNLYNPSSDKGILDGNESFLEYEIRFGEEYEVAGVLTQFLNLDNDTSVAYNAGIRYPDFVDYTPSTYLDTKFLTNMTSTQTTDLAGLGALHLLLDSGTTLTDLTIKTYLATVLQNTYTVTTALIATNYYLFAAGVDAINNIDPSNFTVPPVQPIITNAIDQYTIEVTLSTGQTEVFTFNIEESCLEAAPKRVHYLNELGGYDWFDFELASREAYSVDSKSMKQEVNNLTNAGAISYTKQDRVNRNYCTTVKRRCSVTSNWLTDAQMENMRELVSSPDIYIEEGGDLISVNIIEQGVDIKQELYDQLFLQELTFEYSIDQTRQKF